MRSYIQLAFFGVGCISTLQTINMIIFGVNAGVASAVTGAIGVIVGAAIRRRNHAPT